MEFSIIIDFFLKYGDTGAIIAILLYCTRWIVKEQATISSSNTTNQVQFIHDLQTELRHLREIHNAEVVSHQTLRAEFSTAIHELNKVRSELADCCKRQQHLEGVIQKLKAG